MLDSTSHALCLVLKYLSEVSPEDPWPASPTLVGESDLMIQLQAACGRAWQIKRSSLFVRIFFHGTVTLHECGTTNIAGRI